MVTPLGAVPLTVAEEKDDEEEVDVLELTLP